jgi:hypothetical protein
MPVAKPEPPKAPEFNFPTDKPLADMTSEQQSEYWREKAQKHEKLWKASTIDPKELDALRARAKRADEFDESQKTEQQKLTDKAAKAEAETATTRGELAVMRAAVKHGLSADDLELLGTHGTPEEIDARAEKLAARLKTAAANKPPVDFGGGARGTDVSGGPNFESLIAEATKSGNFTRVIALKEQQHAHLTKPKS